MTALYDHALAPTGLRFTQYSLLATLWRQGGQKGITLSDLAAALDMDRTTLTRNLHPMTQRQFISIAVDATDRRMRRATLTPQGVAALESAQPFWRIAQTRVDQVLGKENVTALHQWVDSVIPAFRDKTPGANP